MHHPDRTAQKDHALNAWKKAVALANKRRCRLTLFGAGRHTRWLLSELSSEDRELISQILDDNPDIEPICGIHIQSPREVDPSDTPLILVSSDRHEHTLAKRCKEVFGRNIKIIRMYGNRSFVTDGHVTRMVPFSPWRRLLNDALFAPERHWSIAQRFLKAYFKHESWRFWHSQQQSPHWGNHQITLQLWQHSQDAAFAERGTYAAELIDPGDRVLDLCCGDGFYAYYFFAKRAASIDAVDLDEDAIRCARTRHAAENITHHMKNVVTSAFPRTRYDVVVWDGAMAHLEWNEIECVLRKVHRAIGNHGVLCGSEALEQPHEQSWDHKVALQSADKVRKLLEQFFTHVSILERNHGTPMLYFRAAQEKTSLGGFQCTHGSTAQLPRPTDTQCPPHSIPQGCSQRQCQS